MKYALITMIESNENNLNSQRGITFSEKRLYEDEAILCFKNWREKGGWLKDINIYTYCPTKNTITDKTKEEFKKLNVTYIENYREETESFFSGFLNVPLCGKIFEQTLEEDILIHIDLDMNLIRPIPEELVNSVADNKFVLVGQYDDESAKFQRRLGEGWDNPLDTGFIISHRKSGFYKYFYEELIALVNTKGDERWKQHCSDQPLYFLEEYVIDKAYNEGLFPVKPIKRYQIGEGYAKVSTFGDEELNKVLFWHEHILYEKSYYDKIREKLEFTKRMGKLL
jgi:hypothetical protein